MHRSALGLFAILDGASAIAPLKNPCLDKTSKFASMPFCDSKLSTDERVADAVKRLTMEEKIAALSTETPKLDSLGLPEYNWWEEATTGVDLRDHESTKFAYPITTGMSFNRTLWKATGAQIGREGRALMNAGKADSTFWTPVINLAREPRWGRNIETPGEDPYLTGEYAEYFVRGFQEAPEDPSHLLASACCKHYVANEMESTTEPDGEHEDRHHVNSAVSMQDLVDSYMKPFQACVEKGRVSSLMCSYNAVNGVPSCANDWLLQKVARENWGFDGYIASDCDADNDVFFSHNYTKTPEEAVQAVLRAGTDVDCGSATDSLMAKYAKSAFDKGLITQDDIDERLKMLFRVRMRLSHFDPLGPLDKISPALVCSEESLAMASDGPRQSAALLKNDGTLPLSRNKIGTVLVVGPTAKLVIDSYYGPKTPCGNKSWTLLDAVEDGGKVKALFKAGVPSPTSEDQSGIAEAVKAAEDADTVVIALGSDLKWAQEGNDATNIKFTDAQLALVEKVAAVAKKSVIVVTLTATPLDISPVLSHAKVGAVLHLGQPAAAVLGVSSLIYGDMSPAGRLIQTIYPESYQDQISIFDFNMRPGVSKFARPDCTDKDPAQCPRGENPGRTYRFYTGKPILPFGYGLSYTSFKYALAAAPKQRISVTPLRQVLEATKAANFTFPKTEEVTKAEKAASWQTETQYAVKVTNTGKMDADDVVLGFLTPPNAGKDGMPLKFLFDFERVHVKSGETVTVLLNPSLMDFARASKDGQFAPLVGEYKVHFGIQETAEHGMGFVEGPGLQVQETLIVI
eukprot:TRINITY_DN74684_c0_g1_i1.p1 TRINITY_DN74684_c0_g1~~TRINITY_DN74684_c0_g1_i1.p1  ORF type:complete len:799 (-),score=165.79 TRINITY_DN74684_c0_g1_i1:519-2915(-)